MEINNSKRTTFWQFLSEHRIEIPIIQRDYAQGRSGKEKLRETFLKDLEAALNSDNSTLKLDFIYGSVENGGLKRIVDTSEKCKQTLNPLDGQQRLTTLWLLHWYIAYKADELENCKDIFKRFTYETRISSREFCERLSEFTEKTDKSIVDRIQNQTWFYSEWKQDPTIAAMLNMLGGLEKRFDEHKDKATFEKYWEKLINKDACPIIFYYLPLHDFGLSDDLYIKMNARGKALTSFENFKADLVGHIKENGWEKEKKPQDTIAHKLDTIWTDIFWKNRSSEYEIDDIYFAFLNRYFLNSLITMKDESEKNKFTAEQLEGSHTFKYLYGNSGDDIKYSSYSDYKDIEIDKEVFEKLRKTLDNFHSLLKDKSIDEINKLFVPNWDENNNFQFIPKYQGNSFSTLTQPQRVVFHAVCRFFEKTDDETNKYDETKLKQWMRVVWNIVENSNSDSNMTGAVRLIDELAEYSHNIYSHLKDRDVSNDFAKEQMREEKEKARKILEDSSWKQKIIEAENHAFFKGAIRFMFTNENGEYDWNLFENRFEKSKLYFDDKGVANDYKENALLLRTFICGFNKWEQFWGLTYNNKYDNWKNILTHKDNKWAKPIHKLFKLDVIDESIIETYHLTLDDTQDKVHTDLTKSKLLSSIASKDCVLNYRYSKYALYKPYANANYNKFVIGDKRNEIFSNLLDNNIIKSEQKIPDLPYFWGWEIYFETNDTKYRWYIDWGKEELQRQNDTTNKWEEVKDVSGNPIMIDNLEDYLCKSSSPVQ